MERNYRTRIVLAVVSLFILIVFSVLTLVSAPHEVPTHVGSSTGSTMSTWLQVLLIDGILLVVGLLLFFTYNASSLGPNIKLKRVDGRWRMVRSKPIVDPNGRANVAVGIMMVLLSLVAPVEWLSCTYPAFNRKGLWIALVLLVLGIIATNVVCKLLMMRDSNLSRKEIRRRTLWEILLELLDFFP